MISKIAVAAASLALGAGTLYISASRKESQTTQVLADVRVARARTGELKRVLRLNGQTSARNFININAPLLRGPESGHSLVLMKLVKSGASVTKGEVIAEIDAQSTQDHVDDVIDLVKQAQSDIQKRRAEHAVEWETLQQTLRSAKAEFEKARLDARTAGLLTDIERELLQLTADEAEARYKELQKDAAFQKAANDAEIRILEITLERQKRHLARHQGDLAKFTIHAPMNGLAVMQMVWRGGEFGQIQEGDQINPGQLFMKVVDPLSMQLEATANQAESSVVRIGQPVEISLDAFPGVQLLGKVNSVGALATGSWMQNYYKRSIPVRISIQGFDPRLIPDLSGAADVTVEKAPDAVIVPMPAVRSEHGKPFLFVKNQNGLERRDVEIGLTNGTEAEVRSGLRAGEEVKLD